MLTLVACLFQPTCSREQDFQCIPSAFKESRTAAASLPNNNPFVSIIEACLWEQQQSFVLISSSFFRLAFQLPFLA
jgi:hypothetical protein